MIKKIASLFAGTLLLVTPLVASAQSTPLPQLPSNPTVQDLENEIQALMQIVTQLIALHHSGSPTGPGSDPGRSPISNPNGSLTAAPFSGAAPLTVTLSGSIPGTSYTLDFGDGSVPINSITNFECPINNPNCQAPTSTISVQHTYTLPGQYRPTVTNGNQILSAVVRVTGTSTQTSNATSFIAATPSTGSAPLSVAFTGVASGAAYTIDFGDGNFSGESFIDANCPASNPVCTTSVNTMHVYTSGGTFAVTLYRPIGLCLSIVGGCTPGLMLATTTVTVTGASVPTGAERDSGTLPSLPTAFQGGVGGFMNPVPISTPWNPNGQSESQIYWHNFEEQNGLAGFVNPQTNSGMCTIDNTPVGGSCGGDTHCQNSIGGDYWVQGGGCLGI